MNSTRARVCPAMPLTTPSASPPLSSTGPCSMCTSAYASELARASVSPARCRFSRTAARSRCVKRPGERAAAEVGGLVAHAFFIGESDDFDMKRECRPSARSRSTTASAPSTPSGPSYFPASRTVSRCEPRSSVFAFRCAHGHRPMRLNAASSRTSRSASRIHVPTSAFARCIAAERNVRVSRPASH